MSNSDFHTDLDETLRRLNLAEAINMSPPASSKREKRDVAGNLLWTKHFDEKGREIHLEKTSGYWSRHCYVETRLGVECWYYNSDGKQYHRMHDLKGNLTWLEEDGVRWYALVDKYPRLYACRDTKRFRIGSRIGTAEELLELIKSGKLKVCNRIRDYLHISVLKQDEVRKLAPPERKESKIKQLFCSLVRQTKRCTSGWKS